MKNIIKLRLLVIAVACVGSTSKADEPVKKEIEIDKIVYELKSLDEVRKGAVIRYEIPDLHRKKLDSIVSSGLLTSILSHGAKVCFKFEREELDDNEYKKLLIMGTYVVSVEPKIFKTGDTIVIGVNNPTVGN